MRDVSQNHLAFSELHLYQDAKTNATGKKFNLTNNLYYRKLIIFKNQLVPRETDCNCSFGYLLTFLEMFFKVLKQYMKNKSYNGFKK